MALDLPEFPWDALVPYAATARASRSSAALSATATSTGRSGASR